MNRAARYLLFVIFALFAAPLAAQPNGKPAPPARVIDPTVQALIDTRPSTPEELLRAIDLMIDFKQVPLARQYLDQLLAANLEEDKLAELGKKFGTPIFLKLSLVADLNPEARQFADAVIAAAVSKARDPQRLAALIQQLQDPSADARRRATVELRVAGSAAAEALVTVMCDANRAAEHPVVRTALVGQGKPAVPPLVACLQAGDLNVQTQAVEVLRRAQAKEAAVYLLAPALADGIAPELQSAAQQALEFMLGGVPARHEATNTLNSQARLLYRQAALTASNEPQEIWTWDSAQSKPVVQLGSPQMAALMPAVRMARDLCRLMPKSAAARRLYLGALLEASVYGAGIDQPLPAGPGTPFGEAAAAGPDAMEELLSESMLSGHIPAAIAAAHVLAEIGTVDMLYNRGAHPNVIVEAAQHSEKRLRFAALSAILKLHPPRPYPGSSIVVQGLAFAASSSGVRGVLAADTHAEEAQRLVGLLAPADFEGNIATRARDVLPMLTASDDYELVLIDYRLAKTNVDELVQQIRREPRTAILPIGLVTEPDDRLRAERLALRDPLTQVIIRPVDAAGMEYQVQRLLARTSPFAVPAEERSAQTRQALAWLVGLSSEPQVVYNLSQATDAALAAVNIPGLTPLAAPLVADLGFPAGQVALVNVASQIARPIEERQAAAEAFRRGVDRFGILLTTGEMLKQYERYNQSETQPKETQAVQGFILDALESRRAAPPQPQ